MRWGGGSKAEGWEGERHTCNCMGGGECCLHTLPVSACTLRKEKHTPLWPLACSLELLASGNG